MALKLADLGADIILDSYLNKNEAGGGNDLTLKLYENDITPNANGDDVVGDYTEANGAQYSGLILESGNWNIAANDPSDADYTQMTFTFSGPTSGTGIIYGYYVVDDDNVLIWAERFGTSFTPANDGDNIKITPKLEMGYGDPVV